MTTLSSLATKDGPIYNRFQISLKKWKEIYKKRNQPGDLSVIKFLEYYGELEDDKM